jgi:hypothetical protein
VDYQIATVYCSVVVKSKNMHYYCGVRIGKYERVKMWLYYMWWQEVEVHWIEKTKKYFQVKRENDGCRRVREAKITNYQITFSSSLLSLHSSCLWLSFSVYFQFYLLITACICNMLLQCVLHNNDDVVNFFYHFSSWSIWCSFISSEIFIINRHFGYLFSSLFALLILTT